MVRQLMHQLMHLKGIGVGRAWLYVMVFLPGGTFVIAGR